MRQRATAQRSRPTSPTVRRPRRSQTRPCRSAGVNAVRCTVNAYPAASFEVTVTRSETGLGVLPATAWPKLMLLFSSERDSAGWTSRSTAAFCETPDGGGAEPEQVTTAVCALRGAGAAAVKSELLASVSVQP